MSVLWVPKEMVFVRTEESGLHTLETYMCKQHGHTRHCYNGIYNTQTGSESMSLLQWAFYFTMWSINSTLHIDECCFLCELIPSPLKHKQSTRCIMSILHAGELHTSKEMSHGVGTTIVKFTNRRSSNFK